MCVGPRGMGGWVLHIQLGVKMVICCFTYVWMIYAPAGVKLSDFFFILCWGMCDMTRMKRSLKVNVRSTVFFNKWVTFYWSLIFNIHDFLSISSVSFVWWCYVRQVLLNQAKCIWFSVCCTGFVFWFNSVVCVE